MFDIVRHHEVIAIFLMVALTAGIVIHYERWRDRKAFIESTQYIWQCVQFQGGASVYTPVAMTKADACEWCSKLGYIAYVDETHHKIFYRSRS
jgi:hypothetical protein